MKATFIVFLLAAAFGISAFVQVCEAQSAFPPGSDHHDGGMVSWNVSPFDLKVFIENKGQFDQKNNLPGSKVLFGVEDHGSQIYFTAKGLSWRFDVVESPVREGEVNRGKEEKLEEPGEIKTSVYILSTEFVGANPEVEIIAEDQTPGLYNYMDAENPVERSTYNAYGYKKIIYKSIYPFIDVQYTFHKDGGIKYAFILHPGADVSKLKMKWTGADKIFKDIDGDMHFTMPPGDIVDHAPETFYADNKSTIASSFRVEGNMVSIAMDNYDRSKEVIIDPWTQAPNYLTANVKSYYIKTDAGGNVYVYGGDNNMRLFKYSSSGALIWTLATVYPVSGGIAVDANGISYISGVFNGYTSRINTSGVVEATYPGYGGSESWANGISCDNGTAYMAGGPPVGIQAINTATGDTVNSIRPLFPSSSPREIRALTVAPNKNIYVLTNTGDLAAIDTALNIIYINTGVVLTYYGPAYSSTLYGNGSGNTFFHAGVNGIAADKSYVYFTNGAQLFKANIATGNTIASTIVSGGQYNKDAGIAVDGCGNIYIGALGTGGAAGKVCKYDSALTFVASIATTGAVYDVCLGGSGDILASGNGFIASLNFSTLACPPYRLSCGASIPPPTVDFTVSDSAFCMGGCVNLTNLSQNASSYQWFFPGATPSVSTLANPENICYYNAGAYSIKLVAYNGGGADSLVLDNYIHVNPTPPAPSLSQSHDTLTCNMDTSYTSYQWYADTLLLPGETNSFLIITKDGNYNVVVINKYGCKIGVGINVTLGLTTSSEHAGMSISPNPVTSDLLISGNWRSEAVIVSVFNVLGEIIYNEEINYKSQTINCKAFSKGIYFVIISGENQRWYGRFVKE